MLLSGDGVARDSIVNYRVGRSLYNACGQLGTRMHRIALHCIALDVSIVVDGVVAIALGGVV